jgi:hypothetical protein
MNESPYPPSLSADYPKVKSDLYEGEDPFFLPVQWRAGGLHR